MFTKLYLDTTDPKLRTIDIFKSSIFFPMMASVIFHTVTYILFANLVSYIFTGTLLSTRINMRMIVCLIIFMGFGYIARLYNVKDVYKAYDNDLMKTREHLDKLYISWIFIA